MKKYFLIFAFVCSIMASEGNNNGNNNGSNNGNNNGYECQDSDLISNFLKLSQQQQIDTIRYYYFKNSYDTAFMYCKLLIKIIPQNADIKQQKILINTYTLIANLYLFASDYRNAYDCYIKCLLICEKYNLVFRKMETYLNISAIYYFFKNYETSITYCFKSLELNPDTSSRILLLSNLSAIELKRNNLKSAKNYINEALKLSKQYDNLHINSMLNNFGSYYQLSKQYDSAFYYFRLSLYNSIQNKDIIAEVGNLSDIGNLFFEINNTDSALHYINLSNKISTENKFLDRLTENYLTLSEIEKSKGRYKNALKFYETYIALKDSIFNAGIYGSINLIQRQYEVSKTDQQIEELIIDQQIKDNTIHYQRIIQGIVMVALILLLIILWIILLQNNKLRDSYNVLVKKNVEIVELQEKVPEPEIISENSLLQEKESSNVFDTSSENITVKNPTCPLSDYEQNELLKRILAVMNQTSTFCDEEFSLDTLTELLDSNQTYVSYVINRALKMNFRTFLNSYRIKEAQRLLSELDLEKFTAVSVGPNVGFRSASGFYNAFKEVTGVSPKFYCKSVQKKDE